MCVSVHVQDMLGVGWKGRISASHAKSENCLSIALEKQVPYSSLNQCNPLSIIYALEVSCYFKL